MTRLLSQILLQFTPPMLRSDSPNRPMVVRRRHWFLQETRFLFLTRKGPVEITVKPALILGAAFAGFVGTGVIAAATLFVGYKSVEVVTNETITPAEASAAPTIILPVEEPSTSTQLATPTLTIQSSESNAESGAKSEDLPKVSQLAMATSPPPALPPAAILSDASPPLALISPAPDDVIAQPVEPRQDMPQDMMAALPPSIPVSDDENVKDGDHPFPAHLHEPDMMVPLPPAAELAMLSPSLADIPRIGPKVADDTSPEKSVAELDIGNIAMMALPQPPLPAPPARALEMVPDTLDNGLPVFTEESRERKLLRSMAREVRGIRQSLVEIGFSETSLPDADALQNHVEAANFAELAMAVEDHRSMLRKVPLKPPMLYFYISSDYGWRKHPVLKERRFHHGIDLAGTWQETVHAPAPGTVIFAGRKGSFGKVVQVRHAYGVTTTYAHLARITIRKGADVVAGTVVGKMGRTGRVDGAHLHYEIRIGDKSLDPQLFFNIGHRIGVGGELMLATDTD